MPRLPAIVGVAILVAGLIGAASTVRNVLGPAAAFLLWLYFFLSGPVAEHGSAGFLRTVGRSISLSHGERGRLAIPVLVLTSFLATAAQVQGDGSVGTDPTSLALVVAIMVLTALVQGVTYDKLRRIEECEERETVSPPPPG